MRVELRTASTNHEIGVINLEPSQLRRLEEITFKGVEYDVHRKHTVMRRGQPVGVVWLVRP